MGYIHTQTGPFGVPLVLIGAALMGGAGRWWDDGSVGVVLAAVGLGMFVLAASFSRLRVEDRGESLAVRFGPLPIFGTSIPYASIAAARVERTSWIDGLGIHFIPGRGWTFNLWGRDCVAIRTRGGVVRVGTDDPANPERFLRAKAAVRA